MKMTGRETISYNNLINNYKGIVNFIKSINYNDIPSYNNRNNFNQNEILKNLKGIENFVKTYDDKNILKNTIRSTQNTNIKSN